MKLHADRPPTLVTLPDTPPAVLVHPALLSVHDVCAELQCGRTFVYELLRTRQLRAIKLGRLTRISRKELDAFLDRKATAMADGPQETVGVGACAGLLHGSSSVGPRRPTPAPGRAIASALAAAVQQPLLLDPLDPSLHLTGTTMPGQERPRGVAAGGTIR